MIGARLYRALRRQAWLYDLEHDSLRPDLRRLVHVALRGGTRAAMLPRRLGRPFMPPAGVPAWLNLGCGREPAPQFVNVDINPFAGADVWIDLRDRWPFADGTFDAIYLRHTLEHFTEREALGILRQCRRVLAPGGGVRVGVPSLEVAVRKYLDSDFSSIDWVASRGASTGRRFFHYITDSGNHRLMLDYGFLGELTELAGFEWVKRMEGGTS